MQIPDCFLSRELDDHEWVKPEKLTAYITGNPPILRKVNKVCKNCGILLEDKRDEKA